MDQNHSIHQCLTFWQKKPGNIGYVPGSNQIDMQRLNILCFVLLFPLL